jgi:hypothetical protein
MSPHGTSPRYLSYSYSRQTGTASTPQDQPTLMHAPRGLPAYGLGVQLEVRQHFASILTEHAWQLGTLGTSAETAKC